MARSPIPPDIAKMSFEDALGELEGIVKRLEEGESKLDEAIQSYERGAALKRHCEAKLKDAKAKVERITLDPDGGVGATPADVD
jgi:exodeoxyribonuclease VII small subunit